MDSKNTMNAEEKNRLEACERVSEHNRKYFNLIEFDENEKLVMEIRKHPFGLFLIEFGGLFVTAILLAATLFGAYTDAIPEEFKGAQMGILAVGIISIFFVAIGTMLASYIYKASVIFITSEKIAQVFYQNILNRKISQLSIGDVQDVTVSQTGLFARIFHYGTLVIETSGEQSNYTFTFVPDPYGSSKAIVNAHEENLKMYGN